MSKRNLTLPPHSDQLLPTRDIEQSDLHVEVNLNSLAGVDEIIARRLFKRANRNNYGIHIPIKDKLLVTDYLRVREDDTLSLHPIVCQAVPDYYHNELLDDIIEIYYDNLSDMYDVPGETINGLIEGFELVYPNPEIEIDPAVDQDCDGRQLRPASEYPIEIHDILADLRAEGFITNLAKSGCDACGHKAGRELANQLQGGGYTVHGYAGIAANTHPENPWISVQDFDESSWESGDIVDFVFNRAEKHDFRSDIRVEKAELLRQ